MRRWVMALMLGLLGLAGQGGCCLCRRPEPAPGLWSEAAREAVVRALGEARTAALAIDDYTCRFYRHERVNGYLGTRQQMDAKFRRQPFSLYMRWVDPAKSGSELLYVAGRYDDMAFARQGGPLGWLLPTMRVRLDDPMIATRSRHPITAFGMGSAAEMVLESVQAARKEGELQARPLGDSEAHGEPARGFEVLLPDRADSYARRVCIWFDPATGLLKRILAQNEAGDLLEDYAFTRVQPNPGLSDADFDPHNPSYGFYRWRPGGKG